MKTQLKWPIHQPLLASMLIVSKVGTFFSFFFACGLISLAQGIYVPNFGASTDQEGRDITSMDSIRLDTSLGDIALAESFGELSKWLNQFLISFFSLFMFFIALMNEADFDFTFMRRIFILFFLPSINFLVYMTGNPNDKSLERYADVQVNLIPLSFSLILFSNYREYCTLISLYRKMIKPTTKP